MRPSSLKASLMSRTLRRSRALLAILLSRSRSAFCSGFRSSSSVRLWKEPSFTAGTGVVNSGLQRSTLNMNQEVRNSLSDIECFGNILHVCTLCACLLGVSSYFCHCHHPPCCLWRGYRTCRPCLVFPPSAPGWTAPARLGQKKDLLSTT